MNPFQQDSYAMLWTGSYCTHTQHRTTVYDEQSVALNNMQVQHVDRAAQCVIFVWLQWREFTR